MANQIYHCPACGGMLEWSPSLQKLHCPYCESNFVLADFKTEETSQNAGNTPSGSNDAAKDPFTEKDRGENAADYGYTESQDDTNVNPEDLRVYHCSACGAEVITDKTTSATTCAFCGNHVILMENVHADFRPKWIIPFKVEQSQVKDIYTQYIKSRPFTPKYYFENSTIDKIKGIYVPFWMYDIRMEGSLKATGEHLSTSSDAHYIYTMHRVYDIDRAGSVQTRKIPVDGSSKMPDDAMDSVEPFDYKEMVPFDMMYMPGFMAERYDQDSSQCRTRAEQRAAETLRRMLNNTISGYSGLHVTQQHVQPANSPDNAKAEYALLPVYVLFTKYKDKDYLFAINGQTGKTIGNVPIDKGRASLFVILRFAIIFAIMLVITHFIF